MDVCDVTHGVGCLEPAAILGAMARNKKAQRTRSTTPNLITRWGEKIGWGRRVKAVCKPCWEIKYCPYGPLIEEFPLHSERDERSCRIFGHDCPVFYVAEPFTETKELRNISRTIPRVTQFRVLKRENQICCVCKSAVSDPDVEFDHVIPWSKGGPSDEWNIRLLCRKCNRRKRANFEDEFLISNLGDHLAEPMGVELIRWLLMVVAGGREIEAREGLSAHSRGLWSSIQPGSYRRPRRDGCLPVRHDPGVLSKCSAHRPSEFRLQSVGAQMGCCRWQLVHAQVGFKEDVNRLTSFDRRRAGPGAPGRIRCQIQQRDDEAVDPRLEVATLANATRSR